MKYLNITITILIILLSFFTFYHFSKVEKLNNKIELLCKERDDLKHKLLVVEEGFLSITQVRLGGKIKKRDTKTVKKTKPKTPKKIEKIILEEDLKFGVPNRTGEDLVNSLKLKTEL